MKLFSKKYNERALRIERYIMKNKLFFLIAAVLTVFLIGSEIKSSTHEKPEQTAVQVITEEDESENAETNLHWRFYSIDLWILLIGGGFCTAMIIKERRKTKEKLR